MALDATPRTRFRAEMKSLKHQPIVLALEFIVVGLGMIGFGSVYAWLFVFVALLIAFFPGVNCNRCSGKVAHR
jgi:hypothetical protein